MDLLFFPRLKASEIDEGKCKSGLQKIVLGVLRDIEKKD